MPVARYQPSTSWEQQWWEEPSPPAATRPPGWWADEPELQDPWVGEMDLLDLATWGAGRLGRMALKAAPMVGIAVDPFSRKLKEVVSRLRRTYTGSFTEGEIPGNRRLRYTPAPGQDFSLGRVPTSPNVMAAWGHGPYMTEFPLDLAPDEVADLVTPQGIGEVAEVLKPALRDVPLETPSQPSRAMQGALRDRRVANDPDWFLPPREAEEAWREVISSSGRQSSTLEELARKGWYSPYDINELSPAFPELQSRANEAMQDAGWRVIAHHPLARGPQEISILDPSLLQGGRSYEMFDPGASLSEAYDVSLRNLARQLKPQGVDIRTMDEWEAINTFNRRFKDKDPQMVRRLLQGRPIQPHPFNRWLKESPVPLPEALGDPHGHTFPKRTTLLDFFGPPKYHVMPNTLDDPAWTRALEEYTNLGYALRDADDVGAATRYSRLPFESSNELLRQVMPPSPFGSRIGEYGYGDPMFEEGLEELKLLYGDRIPSHLRWSLFNEPNFSREWYDEMWDRLGI